MLYVFTKHKNIELFVTKKKNRGCVRRFFCEKTDNVQQLNKYHRRQLLRQERDRRVDLRYCRWFNALPEKDRRGITSIWIPEMYSSLCDLEAIKEGRRTGTMPLGWRNLDVHEDWVGSDISDDTEDYIDPVDLEHEKRLLLLKKFKLNYYSAPNKTLYLYHPESYYDLNARHREFDTTINGVAKVTPQVWLCEDNSQQGMQQITEPFGGQTLSVLELWSNNDIFALRGHNGMGIPKDKILGTQKNDITGQTDNELLSAIETGSTEESKTDSTEESKTDSTEESKTDSTEESKTDSTEESKTDSTKDSETDSTEDSETSLLEYPSAQWPDRFQYWLSVQSKKKKMGTIPKVSHFPTESVLLSKIIRTPGMSRSQNKRVLRDIYNTDFLFFYKKSTVYSNRRGIHKKSFKEAHWLLDYMKQKKIKDLVSLFSIYTTVTQPVLAYFLIRKRSYLKKRKSYLNKYQLKIAKDFNRIGKLFHQTKSVYFRRSNRKNKTNLDHATRSFLAAEFFNIEKSEFFLKKKQIYETSGYESMNNILIKTNNR